MSVAAYANAPGPCLETEASLSVTEACTVGTGKTLYVDPGTRGEQIGTPGSPFETIGAALSVAEPGDFIQLAPGDYVENVVIDRPDITIQGAQLPAQSSEEGQGAKWFMSRIVGNVDILADRTVLENTEIESGMVALTAVRDCRIRNNEFSGASLYNIVLLGAIENTFSGNIFGSATNASVFITFDDDLYGSDQNTFLQNVFVPNGDAGLDRFIYTLWQPPFRSSLSFGNLFLENSFVETWDGSIQGGSIAFDDQTWWLGQSHIFEEHFGGTDLSRRYSVRFENCTFSRSNRSTSAADCPWISPDYYSATSGIWDAPPRVQVATSSEETLWYADEDGDGYGNPVGQTRISVSVCQQPQGFSRDAEDCDDDSITVYPGAEELCNGIDDNCNGTIDEEVCAPVIAKYGELFAEAYATYGHKFARTYAALEEDFSSTTPTDWLAHMVEQEETNNPRSDQPTSSVGILPGTHAVTDSGAASYQIPIDTPPGRAGIEPRLFLTYNSQAGNGMVGVGWNLTGFSKIERCRRTLGEDGFTAAYVFTAADAYCLDGVRLLRASSYTTSEYEYSLEGDPATRIHGVEVDASGPRYFVVWRKDGTTITYGKEAGTTIQTPRGIRVWAAHAVEDRHGNTLTIRYETETGVLYPRSVHYTGNGALEAQREVFFLYESRSDPILGYVAGERANTLRRLHRIHTYAPPNRTHVYTYHLKYTNKGGSKRSRLVSLRQCVGNSEVCKSPTIFEWKVRASTYKRVAHIGQAWDTDAVGRSMIAADFDGDGAEELAHFREGAARVLDAEKYGYFFALVDDYSQQIAESYLPPAQDIQRIVSSRVAFATDYNHDGYQDLLKAHEGGGILFFRGQPSGGLRYDPTMHTDAVAPLVGLGDVDGDGRRDWASCVQKIEFDSFTPEWAEWQLYFSQGTSRILSREPITFDFGTTNCRNARILPLDYDSDGVSNLLFNTQWNWWASTSKRTFEILPVVSSPARDLRPRITGVAEEHVTASRFPAHETRAFYKPGSPPVRIPIDLNGDRLTDAVLADGDNLYIWWNTGFGYQKQSHVAFHCEDPEMYCRREFRTLRVIDINGDGKQDLLFRDAKKLRWVPLVLNDANVFVPLPASILDIPTGPIAFNLVPTEHSLAFTGPAPTGDAWVLDATGDGAKEIVVVVPTEIVDHRTGIRTPIADNKSGFQMYKLSGPAHDVIVRVRDGLHQAKNDSSNITFIYAPATDPHVYENTGPDGYTTRKLRAPRLLVSTVLQSSGAKKIRRRWYYRYKDGRFDRLGRGWLGFATRIVEDVALGKVTETHYDNSFRSQWTGTSRSRFPYSQMPVSQTVTTTLPNKGIYRVQTDHNLGSVSTVERGSYRIGIVKSVTETSESSTGRPERVYGRVERTMTHDEWGRIKRLETNYTTFADNMLAQLREDATLPPLVAQFQEEIADALHEGDSGSTMIWELDYADDTEAWLLNRPATVVQRLITPLCNTETENSECPKDSIAARKRFYSYYDGQSGEVATGAVRSVTDGSLGKVFRYDEFGNKTQERAVGTIDLTNGFWRGDGEEPLLCEKTRADCPDVDRITQVRYESQEHMFPVVVTNPKGHRQGFSFHRPTGQIAAQWYANGTQHSWEYDQFGRLTQQIDTNGSVTTHTYEDRVDQDEEVSHWVVASKVPGAKEFTSRYDADGRLVREQWYDFHSELVTRDYDYDSLDQITSVSSEYREGEVAPSFLQFEWDPLGRIAQERGYQPDATTRYGYVGSVQYTTDAAGQNTLSVTDSRGHILLSADSAGAIHYRYSAWGTLSRVVDPEGNETHIEWDPFGRKAQLSAPNLGIVQYRYNGFGEVVEETDARGTVTAYAYDTLGRLVLRSDATNTGTVHTRWAWDPSIAGLGQLGEMNSPDGHAVQYTYDSKGRLETETHHFDLQQELPGTASEFTASFPFRFSYDEYGRVNAVEYPQYFASTHNLSSFQVEYGYTDSGFLQKLLDKQTREVYWEVESVNPQNKVELERFGNGTRTTREYHPQSQRLTSLSTFTESTKVLQSWSFEYDIRGNLLAQTDFTRAHGVLDYTAERFTYDALERLQTVEIEENPGEYTTTFQATYGPLGNLLSRSDVGTYHYGSHRPFAVTKINTDDGELTYAYDANGNQTQRPGYSVAYTPFNKPRAVENTTTFERIEYAYNADQNKVAEVGANKLCVFINALYELCLNEGKAEQSLHLLGSDILGTRTQTVHDNGEDQDTVHYILRGRLGSVEVVTGQEGKELSQRRYGPFGETTYQTGEAIRSGYTGHAEEPQLGLIDMGGRRYDPKIGAFTTPDPTVVAPFYSQSLNRYSYVWNNPFRYTDPTGFNPDDINIYGGGGGVWIDGAGLYGSGGDLLSYGATLDPDLLENWISAQDFENSLDRTNQSPDRGWFSRFLSNALQGVHNALDIVGLVPIAGEVADLINALVYVVVDRDLINASISLNGAIPFLGNSATAARVTGKFLDLFRGFRNAADATRGGPKLMRGVGAAAADNFLMISSSIGKHSGLTRHASRLSGAQQRAVDNLTSQLAAGNMNPGIGTKQLFNGVFEARARNGARVYFRHSPGNIEIVGKSTKANQSQVISILRGLYGQ